MSTFCSMAIYEVATSSKREEDFEMNGLKYIRMRCNLSLADLAKHIGVSRQIISAWENGSRGISEKNRKKLSNFFGIDATYFGTISEENQEEILNKAMYLQKDNGKVYYRYASSRVGETQVFLPELDKGLDEIYSEALNKKKQVVENIERIIQGECSDNLYIHASSIERNCSYYEDISWILSNIANQKVGTRLPYRFEFSLMFRILRQAFDNKDELDFEWVKELFGYTEEDYEWALRMCREIRAHRLKKVEDNYAENRRRRGTKIDEDENKNCYREITKVPEGFFEALMEK